MVDRVHFVWNNTCINMSDRGHCVWSVWNKVLTKLVGDIVFGTIQVSTRLVGDIVFGEFGTIQMSTWLVEDIVYGIFGTTWLVGDTVSRI